MKFVLATRPRPRTALLQIVQACTVCGKNGAHGPNVQHRVERDSTFVLGLVVNQLLGEMTHVMEIPQSPESA